MRMCAYTYYSNSKHTECTDLSDVGDEPQVHQLTAITV